MIEPGLKQEDETLLRDFERSGSETAFRELVRRHLGVVLGAAMRRIGDRSLAEEVAQNVFTALASKASVLSAKRSLAAWLYRATMLECSEVMRSEQARKRKLEAFSKQTRVDSDGQSVWREALPVLDEAIDALPAVDRNMILLRFFERKSFQQIGATLGKSEDAAQKQCERALSKLSRLLRQKGVAVPVAVLASSLTAKVAQAVPAGLTVAISQSALAGASALSAKTLIIQALDIMAHAKAKTATAMVLAASLGVALLYHFNSPEEDLPAEPAPSLIQNEAVLLPDSTAEVMELQNASEPAPAALAQEAPPEPLAQNAAFEQPDAKPADAEDLIAASPFRASASAMLQPGEILIAGGWETTPGMRTFVFITAATLEPTRERPLMVAVTPLILEAGEEVWRAFGFDTLMARAPDSSTKETLSRDLAEELRHTLKDILPEIATPGTRLLAWPGHQNRFTVTDDYEYFNTYEIVPSAPGTDGQIFLEAKLGLGHGPQPGMAGVNVGAQYGY